MAERRVNNETSGWLPCGCHILRKQQIVHCEWHQKTSKLAGLLDNIRGYFLQHAGGEDSPYVKKIDELIPRKQ